ncbi:MAG: type II toxin-antitoxin system VapC family toxin [SAR202 cluster bacterium]|nr:type II toxin-antitoxin system VapC family toxin [SAR202 cluster bacterium]
MNPGLKVVIDTHTLIWYLEESRKLPGSPKSILHSIDNGEATGIVPTIVLAEFIVVFEKGKTRIDPYRLIRRVENETNFEFAPLSMGVLRRMGDLAQLELHDRIIVATALSLDAKLITRDPIIRSSGLVECIW